MNCQFPKSHSEKHQRARACSIHIWTPIPFLHLTFTPWFFFLGHFPNKQKQKATPKSRGTVKLRDALPHSKPLIDPGYLTDTGGADLACLVDGVKTARTVVSQPAFDGLRGAELLPGVDVQTDAELTEWVAANLDTGYHPVGTCAIGTVVDAALCVRGVQRLRVVDASVFPTIPNGNTQAATFMVSERAAEFILEKAAASSGRHPG